MQSLPVNFRSFAFFGQINKGCPFGPQVDFIAQNLADEVPLALVSDRFRQNGGHHALSVPIFMLFEKTAHYVELAQLIIQEPLPNRFNARIFFLFGTAVVVIDFIGFVQQPLFEPSFIRIDNRLLLSHMLLFDMSDFRIQLPGQRIAEERPNIHVVISGLLLSGHDRQRMHFGQRLGVSTVVGIP